MVIWLAAYRQWNKNREITPLPNKQKISLLIPFRTDNAERERNYLWLIDYWRSHLPEAEIVIGTDESTPFCKTAAVNDAFSRATGDVLVILDADCYISAYVIRQCVADIRKAIAEGRRLWFVPYRRLYRMTKQSTETMLKIDPASNFLMANEPNYELLEDTTNSSGGHWYGALIQILPREAWIGMDERFKGWGGEDASHMLALDTLYSRRKTTSNAAYHMWHPTIKGDWKYTRQWPGQEKAEANQPLAEQYIACIGDVDRMRRMISIDGYAGTRNSA